MLAGLHNQVKNPQAAATKKTRRAITIHMLKLIEHAIAVNTVWSDYEKSLRWAVVLVAWWGSFRIGELLPKAKHSFCPSSALLASDVTFKDNSVAIWLRSPKVEKEVTGDIVEVWDVPMREDLNPLRMLGAYVQRRREKFGEAETLPMFLHENGEIYTKLQLNTDLSNMLALYPELDTATDKWSGHSFRAGISTVLSLLGFSKEDIQAWGRWSSDAYQRYIKDTSQRRKVCEGLIKTFKDILSFV